MARRTLRLPRQTEKSVDLAELSELLADDRFVKYLWRWFGKAGIYRSTYSGSAEDTFYREGSRALGLDMLAECQEARDDALRLIFTRGGEGIPGRSQLQRSTPEEPDELDPTDS